ncbi:MAG: complex I subunit 5 family protein [Eubacteriales bacterium]|nr:complex I subunit 5 family protein [Eubacteriales bacterium]
MEYAYQDLMPTFAAGRFQLLYGSVATVMWVCALLFSREYMQHRSRTGRFHAFMILTYCATTGVFLSGDLLTLFVCFEVMSFASYVLVVQEETPEALDAGYLYLAVSVAGGMMLLMGLFLLQDMLGTLDWTRWMPAAAAEGGRSSLYIAGGLAAAGFGAKAGLFPLHIWLPKAHPAAPAPASALLSGILTKTGIFGLIILSVYLFDGDAAWGTALLILGLVTMFLGAVLALFSVDLKRTLACSSVSQIGFIVLGIAMLCILGDHNTVAARGVVLHMVNHSAAKLLLFLAAGAIYLKTHQLDLNGIRGFGRGKPLLGFLFLVGAASVAGLPFTSGYVSKTLLHETIVERLTAGGLTGGLRFFFSATEWIFLLTGALTVAYMTKLFVCIFLERNTDDLRQAAFQRIGGSFAQLGGQVAVALPALFLLVSGLIPHRTLDILADYAQDFLTLHPPEHAVPYYAPASLSGALISMILGALIYRVAVRRFLMPVDAGGCRRYAERWPAGLTLERCLFRPLLRGILWLGLRIFGALSRSGDSACRILLSVGGFAAFALDRSVDLLITTMENNLFRQIHSDEERFSPLEWMRNHPMADFWRRSQETFAAFAESLSFGLLATVIGLCAVLVYLL